MSNHRDFSIEQPFNGPDSSPAAFELDSFYSGLFDELNCYGDRIFFTDVVRAEWQVPDQQREADASPYCAGVVKHLINGYGKRCLMPKYHFGKSVSNQNHVHTGGIPKFCHRIVIR